MSFKASDKVICVDDSFGPHDGKLIFPDGRVEARMTYCVDHVRMSPSGKTGLVIVGKPILSDDPIDWTWEASRFRKLQEIQLANKAKAAVQVTISRIFGGSSDQAAKDKAFNKLLDDVLRLPDSDKQQQ